MAREAEAVTDRKRLALDAIILLNCLGGPVFASLVVLEISAVGVANLSPPPRSSDYA